MWFPPYPAPSIARSALPNAPVRDEEAVRPAGDRGRWGSRRARRRLSVPRPARPRLA